MRFNTIYRTYAQKTEDERNERAIAKRDALKNLLQKATTDDEKSALEYAVYLVERMHNLRSFTQEEVRRFENL